MFKKSISLILSLSLVVTQPIFAQGLSQLNMAQYLGQASAPVIDSFRPAQLRYFSYENLNNGFRILLDKGDDKDIKDSRLKEEAKELMDYFLIGVTLPNDAFWVNLRPDSPDNIIDPELEKTDLGRILLEADLQLKKDTAGWTSPQTPEGRAYWDKLYKKAGELFGTENITITTLTRPWIVPGEIVVREGRASAYIYKATLKVMLEEDYLKGFQLSAGSSQQSNSNPKPLSSDYSFSDPRLKELNKYSTQLIKETIIPKLTREVNSGKRYAKLRQAYYSLVLSRWFKMRFRQNDSAPEGTLSALIDLHDLTGLTSKEPYDKLTYFKQYQESFAKGEYNLKEPVHTPYGQSIRAYMSGGFDLSGITKAMAGANTKVVGIPIEEQLTKTNNRTVVLLGNNFQKPSLSLAASPVVDIYEYAFRRAGILNDYERGIIEDSLYCNQLLAAYKLAWILKDKIKNNQVGEDLDAKTIDKWLHSLERDDCDRIKGIVNGVLGMILLMFPQGSGLWNTINDQAKNLSGIQNNYIAIIAVLNAAIGAFNKELEFSKVNRRYSKDDLNTAESELRKALYVALTQAMIVKIYNMPGFNRQILVETYLYVNDFKSALNSIPIRKFSSDYGSSLLSDYEYSVLKEALKNLPVQRKDFMAFNTAVVPAGKPLMRELEKSRRELASELQAIKDRFWPERSEWAKLSGLILFDSDYHKYRKQLFAALTDMQDSIEKTSAGDNFDNSISALDRSSQDLDAALSKARIYLNDIFSINYYTLLDVLEWTVSLLLTWEYRRGYVEIYESDYRLEKKYGYEANIYGSEEEVLRCFPKRYIDLYYSAHRIFSALEKYKDQRGVLKDTWNKYNTALSSNSSPLTLMAPYLKALEEAETYRLFSENKEGTTNEFIQSDSPVNINKDALPADFAKGGIDFTDRAMRIGLEPMGSFADLRLVLPRISNVEVIDLDNEFKQIQAMATAGLRPADIRILEFATACYYRGEFNLRLGEITACIQQAHFLDEGLGRESSPTLRLATLLPEVLYSYHMN